ncbi:hypothetical protein [Nonomuraea dietziae]|uniref:hypothetical protein n=1 Tax=Nonomuraea dietziae TaxID=65515 RepID=UPI0031D5B768
MRGTGAGGGAGQSAVASGPVEGTVLTVLEAVARRTYPRGDLAATARGAAAEARAALPQHPRPAGRAARSGVVDAGVRGWRFLEALAAVITDSYARRYDVPAPTGRVTPMTSHRAQVTRVIYLLDATRRRVWRAARRARLARRLAGGGRRRRVAVPNVHVQRRASAGRRSKAARGGQAARTGCKVTYLAQPGRTHRGGGGREWSPGGLARGDGIAAPVRESSGPWRRRRERSGFEALRCAGDAGWRIHARLGSESRLAVCSPNTHEA